MDKQPIKNSEMIAMAIGAMCLTLGISCEKTELTNYLEEDDHAVKTCDSVVAEDSVSIDDKSGIYFELESDSLEEQIEDVCLNSET